MTQSDVSGAGDGSTTRSAISHAGNRRAETDIERSARSFGGGSVQLADLEEVDVRTVFQNDGDGFSGWLSGNLDRLAKELGISGLREVSRDIAVGSFTVDILRSDITRTMKLLGCRSLPELNRSYVETSCAR